MTSVGARDPGEAVVQRLHRALAGERGGSRRARAGRCARRIARWRAATGGSSAAWLAKTGLRSQRSTKASMPSRSMRVGQVLVGRAAGRALGGDRRSRRTGSRGRGGRRPRGARRRAGARRGRPASSRGRAPGRRAASQPGSREVVGRPLDASCAPGRRVPVRPWPGRSTAMTANRRGERGRGAPPRTRAAAGEPVEQQEGLRRVRARGPPSGAPSHGRCDARGDAARPSAVATTAATSRWSSRFRARSVRSSSDADAGGAQSPRSRRAGPPCPTRRCSPPSAARSAPTSIPCGVPNSSS